MSAQPQPAVKENIKLEPGRFHGLEFKCNHWQAVVPVEHTLDNLLDPAYWSMLAERFSPFDEVRALAEDGTWIAYLIVRETGKNYVKMHLDRLIPMEVFDPSVMEGQGMNDYTISFRGVHYKWSVKRKKDNAYIHEQAASRGEAVRWLQEHLKAVK
jgi:hypothetical protein